MGDDGTLGVRRVRRVRRVMKQEGSPYDTMVREMGINLEGLPSSFPLAVVNACLTTYQVILTLSLSKYCCTTHSAPPR